MTALKTPHYNGSVEQHTDAMADAVDSASKTGSAQEITTSARHSHDERIDDNARMADDRPYSVFTKSQKWVIVALVSLAAVFRYAYRHLDICGAYSSCHSPLTASIYLPAIPTLSHVFGKSTELINLTVTLYMVFQGICECTRLWNLHACEI